MATGTNALKAALGILALAAWAPGPAWAGTPPADQLTVLARTLVENMAANHFNRAEADFTSEMKTAAPPGQLRGLWQTLVNRCGAFQKTGNTATTDVGGYTSVIVRGEFKNRAIGFEVTFDSARRIAGLHLVPPP